MPNNKKKSKKKGSKPSNSSNDKGLRAFATGKSMSPSKLSKKAPDVAQGIRDGKINPKDLPEMTREALEKEAVDGLTKMFGNIKCFKEGMQVNRIDSLQIMVGGDILLSDLTKCACGDNEELRHHFAHLFYKDKPWKDVVRKQFVLDTEGNLEGILDEAVLKKVQQAFDETCDKLEWKIVDYMRKPLKEACGGAYKVTFMEFMACCVGLINKWEHFRIENLARDLANTTSMKTERNIVAAAEGIQAGFDTIRITCWECGKVDPTILKCTACSAARYCSKACQHKSWKAGHKGACCNLKTMYENFTDNYSCVDAALKRQAILEDCPLPPAGCHDFMIVPFLLHKELLFKGEFEISSCRISIETMYKSLSDIVSGKQHWMFRDEDIFSENMDDYLTLTSELVKHGIGETSSESILTKVAEKNGVEVDLEVVRDTLKRVEHEEFHYMIQALKFLAIDISTMTGMQCLQWTSEVRDCLCSLSPTDELLSASRFVGIYWRFSYANREEYYDPKSRAEFITKAFAIMMQCFHTSETYDEAKFIEAMKEVNAKIKS